MRGECCTSRCRCGKVKTRLLLGCRNQLRPWRSLTVGADGGRALRDDVMDVRWVAAARRPPRRGHICTGTRYNRHRDSPASPCGLVLVCSMPFVASACNGSVGGGARACRHVCDEPSRAAQRTHERMHARTQTHARTHAMHTHARTHTDTHTHAHTHTQCRCQVCMRCAGSRRTPPYCGRYAAQNKTASCSRPMLTAPSGDCARRHGACVRLGGASLAQSANGLRHGRVGRRLGDRIAHVQL